MASIRKRRGRWQAQVRKGGVAASATFENKAQAERWARRLEHEIDEGRASGKGRVAGTVGDLVDKYEVAARKRGLPLGRSKLGVLDQLRKGLGDVPLRRLTADRILDYARKRTDGGAGAVTVGIDLTYLGSILRGARGLLGAKVSDAPVREAREALKGAGMVGRSHERDRRPTPEEIAALCAAWRANPRQIVPMADIVEFAIATAMRREEICRLRWADLDGASRTVVIRDRKDPRRKVGNHETVPLIDLAGYDPLAIIERQPRRGEVIFPFKPESLTRAFERVCAELGIKDLRFHDLRHEGVSRLFEAGLAIEQVALISGHKEWRTLRRYTHLKAHDLVSRYRSGSSPATPGTPPDGTPPHPPAS